MTYREAYDMHASSGILFNHESPIRGETFITADLVGEMVREDMRALSVGVPA